MKRYTTLTRCALLTAMALIISLLENFIPIPVPGVKLGIANAVSLYLLLYHRPSEAFAVLTARLLLAALIGGNPSSLLYSAVGGLLALTVCWLLHKTKFFSPVGLSVAGAALHHVGQLISAAFITGSTSVIAYLPVMLLCSLFTGTITGLLCILIYKRIKISR